MLCVFMHALLKIHIKFLNGFKKNVAELFPFIKGGKSDQLSTRQYCAKPQPNLAVAVSRFVLFW